MQVCPSHGHLEDDVDLQKYVLNSISGKMTFSQIVLLLERLFVAFGINFSFTIQL